MTNEEARKADMAIARSLCGKLCGDCPPAKYPEAPTRCLPCPRKAMMAQLNEARDAALREVGDG